MKWSSFAISTLFVLVTLSSSLKIAGTMGYYALFTEDFVERFCENKAKPALNCDGKCALAKMLLQQADEEQAPINLDWLKNETVLFIASFFTVNFSQLSTIELNNLQYSNLYDFRFMNRIIHPPQL